MLNRISVTLFWLYIFLAVPPIFAATVTVTNTNDSGANSLRDAISRALPGDTIDFSLAYPVMITLTSGELAIDKDLTISGPGASNLTISGNISSRIFNIRCGCTVTISHLSIKNGYVVGFGGGILTENGANLTITNSTFSGNSATHEMGGSGGAIYAGDGNLTITNSTFSGNSATGIFGATGGGIYTINQTLTITNSTFSGNSATSELRSYGGGIYIDGREGHITNSTFSDNSAYYGGGINILTAGGTPTLTITNSTFSGNSASHSSSTGDGGSGGGIMSTIGVTLTITNSTFSGNSAGSSAGSGGGIYNQGTVTLINSTFSDNSAGSGGSGGGIYAAHDGNLTITNSTFSGNSAGSGGGIYLDPSLSAIIKNTIVANSPSGGNCFGLYSSLTSQGYNLSDDTTCTSVFNQAGDLNNISAGLDPNGLQNNGGATKTIALLNTSPAVDTVPVSPINYCTAIDGTTPITTDERGVARPQGISCDIGAFELGSENHPPIANAGQNLTITSEDYCRVVQAVHSTATDPDNDSLTYRWLKVTVGPNGQEVTTVEQDWKSAEQNGVADLNLCDVPLVIGTHTLRLEVSDGKATAKDDMLLTVENSAPHAAPTGGGDYAPNNEIKLGGQVSDFDGDWLTYIWSEGLTEYYRGQIQAVIGGVPVDLPDHKLYMGLGTHTVTLTVDDGTNLPVSSNIIINVIDSSKPTLSPEPDKSILWPPNHKMVNISINANASDDSGFVTLSATVASNEPQDGLGDGDMDPDWTEPVINQQTGVITIQLRAERSGSGNGREYTVFITAKDASNNISTVPVKILVPHDKGK